MKRTCVLISYVWPEPQSSAAGLRDLNLIEGLRQAGHEVIIASAAQNEPGRILCEQWAWEKPGVSVHPILLNDSSFDSWIARLRPELVVLDRFVTEEQFGWRVRESSPESLLVLDTQDLHFLRASREAALRKSLREGGWSRVDSGIPREWDADLACRELASIHRVDLTWLVSDDERRILEQEFAVDGRRLAVSRFAYPTHARDWGPGNGAGGEFHSRAGFVLLGNFRHAPNLDAFRWVRAEVWPRIRALKPDAELHLYGAYPPKEVMEAHQPRAGFHVHGPAKTLAEVFEGRRVSLAPLRFGAGIKGKVSDSWAHGVPVAGTSIAAEGMRGSGDWGGVLADDAESLARVSVELHEREELWSGAVAAGGAILSELFSEVRFERDLLASLEQARATRARMGDDWIRGMLTHSFSDSYRYFGRWLEAKAAMKGSR